MTGPTCTSLFIHSIVPWVAGLSGMASDVQEGAISVVCAARMSLGACSHALAAPFVRVAHVGSCALLISGMDIIPSRPRGLHELIYN